MRNEIGFIDEKNEMLDEIGVDISKLIVLCNRFYNLCIVKNVEQEKSILNLMESRTMFESSLTILKSYIEPENNNLIERINQTHQSHDALGRYIEIFLTILDSEQKDLEKWVMESKKIVNKFIVDVAVKSFREKIIDYMSNIVVMPLSNSIIKYLSIKNRNKELFEYILFREVFISSKLKGSQDRLRMIVALKSHGGATFRETNITKIPSRENTKETLDLSNIESPPDTNSPNFEDFFRGYNEDSEGDNEDV